MVTQRRRFLFSMTVSKTCNHDQGMICALHLTDGAHQPYRRIRASGYKRAAHRALITSAWLHLPGSEGGLFPYLPTLAD